LGFVNDKVGELLDLFYPSIERAIGTWDERAGDPAGAR
jgi:hypothetical protein